VYKQVYVIMFKELQAAFQYYADNGRLMTIRRAETEEITLLMDDGHPLATLRTEPSRYIRYAWDTREIDHNYVLTSLVCDHVPPIDKFESVWEHYCGIRNIIVCDIKMPKGAIRDLSNENINT